MQWFSNFPIEKCQIFKMESESVGWREYNLFVIHALPWKILLLVQKTPNLKLMQRRDSV